MKIRRMELRDIPQIAEIEKQCFSLPWSEKEIEKTFLSNNSIYCVAEDNGSIVGYVGTLHVLDEGNIINVAVIPTCRCRGIAKGLMEYLFSELKSVGVKNITLEVRKSNTDAIYLYESFGFKAEGIRKNFYERPVEDAVIMWLHCELFPL